MGRIEHYANFLYTRENVEIDITYPHNGQTKRVFFDPLYEGRNGVEFFRDRLGYRLVLREARVIEWVGQNGTLEFQGKIQNVGFSSVVNNKRISVLLQPKGGSGYFSAATALDARDWQPAEDGNSRADNSAAWRDLNFSLPMSAFGNVPSGSYDIYLKINDPKEQSENRRCIRFANYDIWNAALGANLIGSVTVR